MNWTGDNQVSGRGGIKAAAQALVALAVVLCVFDSQATLFGAKVVTKEAGFHRVSVTNLASALGMTTSQVATMTFEVMNAGIAIPSLRHNGDVIFFARKYENRYTDENVYWVVPGNPVGGAALDVQSGTSPYAASFLAVRRHEQNLVVRADLVQQESEDPILWRLFTSGLSTRIFNTTVPLDHVAPNASGTITVRLKGSTDIAGRYYHRARVDVNGVTVGTMDFEGFENKVSTFTIASGLLLNGNNAIRIESTPPSGTTFDSFYLDYIEVQYDRAYAAVSNRAVFHADAGSVQISGFSSTNLLVQRVTSIAEQAPVAGFQTVVNGTNVAVNFIVPASGTYAVAALGAEWTPVRVSPSSSLDLRAVSWQLDHLVISHPTLVSAAQPIVTHRLGQGLRSALITIDDVYDSFNYGIRDVRALERFLTYAYRNWLAAPRYVLLVGDGSLDYKNQLGFNDSQIPAVPLMGQNGLYASDYLLGDPSGAGQQEIAVGRIPFNAVSNVNDFVVKMLNYENDGNWRTNHLVSSDQNDYGGDFLSIGEELTTNIIDRNIIRAHLTTTSVSFVRDQMINGINEGREMAMYVGHGTPNQLSAQQILLTSDMASLTNAARPTTFLALGCLIGTFNAPGITSLGEGIIKAKGGAANVVAAATLISANDGKVLSERFLEEVYINQADRIGDAWIVGKNRLTETGRFTAFRGFQLMGDPASAIGNTMAPRPGPVGPSRGSFDEWKKSVIPPVSEDLGFILTESGDEDGDQADNYTEYMAGTNPFDPMSLLRIVKIRRPTPGNVQVTWPSTPGRIYRLEYTDNVKQTYQLLSDNITATTTETFSNFVESGAGIRFYRVSVY